MRIGLITARGGSRGLPRKNTLPLLGEPLIAWTTKAALGAKSIDAVFVSAELSQDDTGSEPVIAHALEYLAARRKPY
jgi:CMP-N,N'-diacetyllegionaminic acid synthase